MVDLPSIPDSVPQLRAPTSRVSPSEIAQPYNELAANLQQGSDVLSKDIAVPMARQAGLQAVTRDDQGNLQGGTRLPIIGEAADAYQAAVKFSALAQGEAEAKRQDMLLSKQFPNDPEGYRIAAENFRKEHVKDYTAKFGADVGITLGRTIDNQTTYNYRWLLLKQEQTIKHDFDTGTKAKAISTEEDVLSAIATSDPNKKLDPAITNKIDERVAISQARVNNPILRASPEVEALELKQFDQKVGAARFTSHINDLLRTKGVNAAHDAIFNMEKDESIPPNQRMINHEFATAAIKNYVQDQERDVVLASKAQKQTDQMLENAIIVDSASGKPTITENDIKTNPQMSPESKIRMLGWLKRDGMPEPLSRVSQQTTMELFQRMNLEDGDPQKITDLRPVRDAYVHGMITRQDEEWLEKRAIESRSPDGTRLDKIRQQFTKAIEPVIDKSNPMMGKIDQDGKLQHYAFERFVDQKIDEYRKAGKNPADLFQPDKPDYLGKPEVIAPYQKSLSDSLRDMTNRLTGKPAEPAAGSSIIPNAVKTIPITPRQPGETPAAYLKRIGAPQ